MLSIKTNGGTAKRGSSLGVEHASDEAIIEALHKVVMPAEDDEPKIARQTLLDYGLIAGAQARERRERLGDELKIGYTNAKQLEKRLTMFRINEAQLHEAMRKVEETL